MLGAGLILSSPSSVKRCFSPLNDLTAHRAVGTGCYLSSSSLLPFVKDRGCVRSFLVTLCLVSEKKSREKSLAGREGL